MRLPLKACFHESMKYFPEYWKLTELNLFAFSKNCINRDNRYDIMIQIDMSRESLENYDNCQAHIIWKEEFFAYIEKKAIFDFE